MRNLIVLVIASLISACGGGGSSGGSGGFGLIQFLEGGKDNIPRNRVLTFRFSAPLATNQDFFERLKIQNVQTANGLSDFSRAVGTYVISAETALFFPRLPEQPDRSDSGFRENGNYHVFLKGGPDAIQAAGGAQLALGQEILFNTSQFFEDTAPSEPPRVLQLIARDPGTGSGVDISRDNPDPAVLSGIPSATLVTNNRVIEPGAGGPPNYDTRWQFELHVSEAIDPLTVTDANIEMIQVTDGAINGPETAVSFRVPITVRMIHTMDNQGNVTPFVRVTMVQTLVDNARYRIRFSGNILGIDFRKQFIGENGLTGDGLTLAEPGGLGYTSEFVVFDRPGISASRAVDYDPLVDGINPELGQTTTDEDLFNGALYNPLTDPGKAVGFLPAFGAGEDGDFAASGSSVTTLDTGDMPNALFGQLPIDNDADPNDEYSNQGLPSTGTIDYDIYEPTEWHFTSMTVSSSATLRIIGVNPARIRVVGIVSIVGRVEVSGSDGAKGGGGTSSGGAGGAGGFAGGDAKRGDQSCTITSGNSCSTIDSWYNRCAAAKNKHPYGLNGEGPGRGHGGGGTYPYHATLNSGTSGGQSGTGGGGGSHATKGEDGDDKYNTSGAPGSVGPSCSVNWSTPNAGVIGVRGVAGPAYGDPEGLLILVGGSGGGGGGPVHCHQFANGSTAISGGGGGGGGGWLEIVASSSILINGTIDASGGDGGIAILQLNTAVQGWDIVSGSGGGGGGGTINLISGANLNLTGAVLDARGGAGGGNPGAGTPTACNNCNEGGDGGQGFLLLMDADGIIDGYIPNAPNTYPTHSQGFLTIGGFNAGRFAQARAVTELFPMPAANPRYVDLAVADVVGNVNPMQEIEVWASSSRPDSSDPLSPDPTPGAENPAVHVASIVFQGGGAAIELKDSMTGLNPFPIPNREAFVRIRAEFKYVNVVEAALGPFATIDRVKVSCTFNG